MKKDVLRYKLLIFLFAFMLLSGNSEAQWKKLTNIPSPYDKGSWLDIYFLKSNPNYGWVCGWLGYVLRTSDGGFTWQGTKIDIQNSNLQLECIRFADEHTGYTSGSGMIFKSTDGGVSWFDVTDPRSRDLWGNYFISPDTGIVVGGGCDSPQNFFRTTDGGNTWNLYATNVANSGLTHVIMESGNGTCFATSSGKLWISTNGGIKWGVFCISGDDDWQEQLAHKYNSFLLPFSGGCTGGGVGGMRMSTDFGKTWREKKVNAAMFGSFLLDSLRGWSVGWNQSAYYTSDGGFTWELLNCGIDPPNTLDDIWFINDTTAYTVGSGIWRLQGFQKTYPEISILGDSVLCEGDSVTLTSKDEYEFYNWSTGDTTRSIVVSKAGTYILKTKHTKCDTSFPAKAVIKIHPKPAPQILANKSFNLCEGDSAVLSCSVPYISYSWSTGETMPNITVKKAGTYSVDIIDSNGCKSSASVTVQVFKNPEPKILSNGRPSCVGDSLLLYADQTYADYNWFLVPDATPFKRGVKQVAVHQSGKYVLRVRSAEGCEGETDTLDVTFRQDSNSIKINTVLSSGSFRFDSIVYSQINCKNLSITNTGWRDLTISNIYLASNTHFSMPQTQFPIQLTPGETRNILICFSPNKLGELSDSLIIEDNCWPHNVLLKGFCKVNTYNSPSECGIGVVFKTKTVPGKYMISFGQPYPNPASTVISIPYDLISENEIPAGFQSPEIFNSLGIKLNYDKYSYSNQVSSDNEKQQQGNLIIDTKDIESGIYFITLKVDGSDILFPILISK